MTEPSQQLRDLADAKGVATSWWDWRGEHRQVPAETLRAVLAAMGEETEEESLPAALERVRTAPWRRTLPPTVIQRQGTGARVPVHVTHGSQVALTVHLEGGGRRPLRQLAHDVAPREIDGRLVGEAAFELPEDLPLGWHEIVAEGDGVGEGSRAVLVAAPERLELPTSLQQAPARGLMTQLYQVRSRGSWGIGDLGDLAVLGAWTAREHGSDFVLVNPLHAAEPVAPMEPSPYLPTSRRFVNPVYIDVRDLPGAEALPEDVREQIASLGRLAGGLDTVDRIDRDAVWSHKEAALRLAHRHLAPLHEEAMRALVEDEGRGLVDFATWCSLAREHGLLWRSRWPAELHDPDGEAVLRHRDRHRDEVDFHIWLQWLVRHQLDGVRRRLHDAGMGLGVITDLAVGIHPEGADSWALGDVLAQDIDVGAPPDQFNQLGQNWSQPPWRPDRLAEVGYAPFRDMLRAVLRGAGGVRIDHVMGLFRLWWVPDGAAPADGAYVYYDHEALTGILALEAHRAGALVIGEDLGVVEPKVREDLAARGVLGTSIVWFEWVDGAPRPPEDYRELCLASVTTHDLPPTAGYLDLEHVRLRERLGLLTRPVEEERAAEEASIEAVRRALRERGLLEDAAAPVGEVVRAMHEWLALTPSRLHGIALTDLVGDVRAINQPGTDEEYPNWRLPLAGPDGRPVLLDDLVAGGVDRKVSTN